MKIFIFLITWILCGILGFRMILRLDSIHNNENINVESEIMYIDAYFVLYVLGGYATFITSILPYVFIFMKKQLSFKQSKKLRCKFYKFILGKDIVE